MPDGAEARPHFALEGSIVHWNRWSFHFQMDPRSGLVLSLVRYDDRAGSWMFHCHILDHADGGLMGTVDVGVPHVEHVEHTH